jgi:hypothetical protein
VSLGELGESAWAAEALAVVDGGAP